MKIVFISSDVSQSDILANSFLDGIEYKITNQVSLQDIPENATHVTFMYHENYRFPFTIKERYELFKQLHDASFNMLSDEEISDLSYVELYDNSGDIIDAYYADIQNNIIQPYQFYSYLSDFPFFEYEYTESANIYPELDAYHCDISSGYFNDMMYFFNELQKRNKHIVIDFLTCNFVASKIQDIESHFSNIAMRVSTNDTGNPEYGGDWIMEYSSDDTETVYVKDIYFNENISQFSVILDIDYKIHNRTDDTGYYYGYNSTDNYIYFRVRKSDGYLSYLWTRNGSLSGSLVPETVYIPADVKVMSHKSRFSDYPGQSAGETTGVKILKFNTRSTKLTFHSSTFYAHPTLEKIHINDNFIEFEGKSSVFEVMPNLIELVLIGTSLISVGPKTAKKCTALTNVTLGSTIKTIKDSAFSGCVKLLSINLENVTSIEDSAFLQCKELLSINLENVTSIDTSAFNECFKLTTLTLNSNLTDINGNVFKNCYELTSINLENVTKIHHGAFRGCRELYSINLDNVTDISYHAFTYCKKLLLIDIPKIVTIGDRAFQYSSITTFIFPVHFDWTTLNDSNMYNATITNLYYNKSFGDITSPFKGGTITKAYGYQVLDDTNVFIAEDVSLSSINGRNIITDLNSMNYILKSDDRKEQFNTSVDINSTTFTDIQPGDTLVLNVAKTIGNDAFKNNTIISSVQFSSSLESIGNSAFNNCTNLTSVDFTNCTALTSINQDAFRECSNLTSVDFSGCTSLTIIIRAFYNCNISVVNLEDTILQEIKGSVFKNMIKQITSIILPKTLLKLNYHSFNSGTTTLDELFLPPDISFNNSNSSGDSYIAENSLKNISIKNLYYNKANGEIISGNSWPTTNYPINITNAIGYTIDGSDIKIEPNSYQGNNGNDKKIWGYTIKESTNITLSSSKTSYTIDLSNVSTPTTFTFSRTDTSTYLLKVAFTATTSTDISYTNAITDEIQTISSSSIKTKYFNSNLAMTLDSGRLDTITVEYIKNSDFDSNIGGVYDDLEAYDISSSQVTISDAISDVTFIDSAISSINFQNNDITGLRFSGSFTIPDVTDVNTTTLYYKYSIVNNKLYDKLYFTLQDVTIKRDFGENYGSDNSFNITSKKYYINGLETPQLQLIAGESYDCSFQDNMFGIFGDISNNTDASGFNANIFGGSGSISSSDFTINSTSLDVSTNAYGNYYYGHLTTHGGGGLNTNISIVDSVSGNWIQNKNSEHSTIITCYNVSEYSDILHHVYNHDNTGLILQTPERNNPSGYTIGYINGYYNPKMMMKSGSDIIIEITNIAYDSSTNSASELFKQSPSIYISNYSSSNTFTSITDYNNKVLYETNISLQYVKLRCETTNQYYINNDNIRYINIDVSDTMTETISFERFDFDIVTGDQLESISRLDQVMIVNDMKIRCNNVDSSLAPLQSIGINFAPKIRFTIEEQYTDDVLLTYLFYYKKLEYYGYLKTISTPYFGGISGELTLNPLQTSVPFEAYMGSFVVTLNGKEHSKPIYIKVNEISKSDLDNLAYMISITGGLKTEEDIKNTLVSNFRVNTSTENNDKSSIIELFLQHQMKRNISKLYTTKTSQTITILGKPRKTSTFYSTDEPNSITEKMGSDFENSGLSPSTYRPMTFGHSINGPIKIVIQDPIDTDTVYISQDKLFIINHNIKTFVDNLGSDISFDTFISKRMNESTQNDVDISINYYNEYKYPRREFDVSISGGKFEINYTVGSKYNVDVDGTTTKVYTGSALDENGNLNCNENEIYVFNQTDSTNLDSSGNLNHALTVYPTDPSGTQMKYANVNCIPSIGGPLTKTRIFHCFKPKFFSEQMDTNKYYYGSLCEALDVSFGEWWMNELYDGTNINIIVDVNDYDSPSSFRFLNNHIRSIPSSKIKQFIDISENKYIVNDISFITLNYSGDILNISDYSSLYFHFDLSSESINMSSDTRLGIGTFSHITTPEHHIYSSDISSITLFNQDSTTQDIYLSDISFIDISSSISNSDISVNEFDYTLLDIESKHTYVFKPSSFYLNSDLSRSFVAVDVSNDNESILGESNISINNTDSIQFKKKDNLQGGFGSNYDVNTDWSFIDTSMGAYINILPTIPLGDSNGLAIDEDNVITITRNAWDVKTNVESSTLNNQELYKVIGSDQFDVLDTRD